LFVEAVSSGEILVVRLSRRAQRREMADQAEPPLRRFDN
jgi:hypothetical protein